jgi:rhomboid protease GluP
LQKGFRQKALTKLFPCRKKRRSIDIGSEIETQLCGLVRIYRAHTAKPVNRDKTIILCPGCKRLVAYNERRCPHCGLRRPGSTLNRLLRGTGEESGRLWIKGVIYVNVAMFVVSLVAMAGGIRFSANPLYFLSPDSNSLLVLGATGSIPIYRYHRWWTLISAGYLHGGILHIFFNMAAFWQLAPLAIREYGTWRMFTIYTLSGIFGFWISALAGVPLTIGASASICGLIGALVYFGKSRGGDWGRLVYRQVGGWAIGILLFGMLIPGINNWGHAGGFAAGIVLGFLLGYVEKRQENTLHRILGGLCLLATGAVVGLMLFLAVMYRIYS